MSATSVRPSSVLGWFIDYLGFRRNVFVVSLASFLFACGHSLWQQFRGLWLRALGASVHNIGHFEALKEVADAAYQYPSGWLTDRFGRRTALVVASALAVVGYVIWFHASTWQVVFLGLPFVMAWSNPNGPIFATIGDTLPKDRRATGFAVQYLLPKMAGIMTLLGGAIVDRFVARDGPTVGVINGVGVGLAITVALASVSIWVQWRYYVEPPAETTRQFGLFHRSLQPLLKSDILIRSAKRMTDTWLPFFMKDVLRLSYFRLGFLLSVAKLTSFLVYFPGAKASDSAVRRKPFVLISFFLYAVVPLVLITARSRPMLLVAFVMNGLRDVGDPARKAMITDMTDHSSRGRTVGLYYLIRGPALVPAAIIGSYLYGIAPQLTFYAASVAGIAGTLLFALTVKEDNS